EARKFGAAIWEITGKGNNVDFVFEHPGAATFPVSVLVVKRGGMVVICAGTTGYNLTMDARYLWMHQKRVQGSHFANLLQAAQANKLVVERRVDPATSEVFPWEQIPKAHMRMWRNEHKPGNMAVLVSAPTTGLRTFEDVLEASRKRFGERRRACVLPAAPSDVAQIAWTACRAHRIEALEGPQRPLRQGWAAANTCRPMPLLSRILLLRNGRAPRVNASALPMRQCAHEAGALPRARGGL